jgi:septal ring factor EnvC (AmiA/AmiB activator)
MTQGQMSKNKMNNKIAIIIKMNKLKTIKKMNSKVNNSKDHMMNLMMSIFHRHSNKNKVNKIKSKMLKPNNKTVKTKKMMDRMNKNKNKVLNNKTNNKRKINKIKILMNNNHK